MQWTSNPVSDFPPDVDKRPFFLFILLWPLVDVLPMQQDASPLQMGRNPRNAVLCLSRPRELRKSPEANVQFIFLQRLLQIESLLFLSNRTSPRQNSVQSKNHPLPNLWCPTEHQAFIHPVKWCFFSLSHSSPLQLVPQVALGKQNDFLTSDDIKLNLLGKYAANNDTTTERSLNYFQNPTEQTRCQSSLPGEPAHGSTWLE